MASKTILVDVDITVCPSDEGWLEWLQYYSHMSYSPFEDDSVEVVGYDLATYFKDYLEEDVCPYEYWRDKELYKYLLPVCGSEDVLEELHRMGHNIVFVSQLKGWHHKSKWEWLKHYFPYLSGFVGTKEKWLVRGDVLIDDRHSHLNSMPEDVKLIKMESPYTQDIPLHKEHLVYNWDMGVEPLVKFIEGE